MQQGKPAGVFPGNRTHSVCRTLSGTISAQNDGYAAKGRELKQHVMAPLISYFRDARESLGITSKQIAEATGKKNMASHWFGTSQWQLPNEGDYNKLQALFARVAAEKHQRGELEKPHHQLVSTYSELNRQYVSLQEEYKSLRRYFPYQLLFRIRMSGRTSLCSIIDKHPCENRQICCVR